MKLSKTLILAAAGLSLGACSSMEEKNTFMTYGDLQDKVRTHDEQWKTVQAKLDRLDTIEAEILALKQGGEQQGSSLFPSDSSVATPSTQSGSSSNLASSSMGSNESMAIINVAPMVMSAPIQEQSMVESEPTAVIALQETMPVTATTVKTTTVKTTTPAATESQFGVQLASYANRDEAARGWRIVQNANLNTFDGLVPLVNQKDINGRTMYQLKVGPFMNKAFSKDFCNMLKQKGGDCLVTQYNGEAL